MPTPLAADDNVKEVLFRHKKQWVAMLPGSQATSLDCRLTGFPFITFLFFLCCSLLPAGLFSQPLPCDGSFHLFITKSVTGSSHMYRGRINPATGQIDWQEIKKDLGYRVAAAGYSIYDQYIYALEERSLELLRIDAAGNVESLGVPSGLDPEMVYRSGAVNPHGSRFYVIGKDPVTEYDQTLFSITIGSQSTMPRAGRVSILNDFNASVEDLAFDPYRGLLYGYDQTTNKLVRINWTNGEFVNYFSQSMTNVGSLGSLFFDRSGQLYGFGSGSGGGEESRFFTVEKTNGLASSASSGPEGKISDACACPYTLHISKRATPFQVLPCTELLLHYDIVNRAGTAYSLVNFRDTLPDGFTITGIDVHPFLRNQASGIGSNIFSLSGVDLLLDTTRITLRVAVGENVAPGLYGSQAVMSAFPIALGETVVSDDPFTPSPLDATMVEVISGENIDLEPVLQPSCAGDGLTLSYGLSDASYTWSTGDTTTAIFVTEPGQYAVTISTGCALYTDEVEVPAIPGPLMIDLGEDLEVDLGQTITLREKTLPATANYDYRWTVDGEAGTLSCTSCPAPEVRPLVSTTYYLTVTDENGCAATDSMRVVVIPREKVFIPNAFSPDGDGNNDIFYLQGPAGSARVLYFRVFDRWGNLLVERRDGMLGDEGHGWDGRARGHPSPNGVYIWSAALEFPDGRQKSYSGSVMLLKN